MSDASPAPVTEAAPGLVSRLKAWRRRRRAHALFRAAGLFDADWYVRNYLAAGTDSRDPIDHYLETGAGQDLRPHPLFDTGWYKEEYPDVVESGANPLVHFIQFGLAEKRDPNPYFSTRWYLLNNPDAARYPTALSHYVQVGAAALRDPSPRFDVRWYLERNADVAESGLDALSHFLLIGRREGRAATALGFGAFRGDPIDIARIVAVKELEPIVGEMVALMACHCPHGKLKPNVLHYVAGLRKAGVKVVIVAATDRPFTLDPEVEALLSGAFVRDNKGFDFASWVHALRCEPSLYAARTLLLVNDSLIGPTNQAQLDWIIRQVEESPADMVGATDNLEHAWHLQSFFLALKGRLLASYALRELFDRVRVLSDKDDVIRAYELTFSLALQEAGFDCRPIFTNPDGRNSTAWGWRRLMKDGFPFAKTLTLRGDVPDCDTDNWQETIGEFGFDPAIAEETIAETTERWPPPEGDWPLLQPPRVAPRPHEPLKVAFLGPWIYSSGLGEAGRGYLSALWRGGFRLNLHPIEQPYLHSRSAPAIDVTEFDGPADVAILHLNPEAWKLMTEAQHRVFDRARARVCIPVWEMDQVPENWRAPLRTLDAVWAPSAYCADAFGAEVSAPVAVVPHVVAVGPRDTPERKAAARRALGLSEGERQILYVFDGSSYLVRKNPEALVRAFAATGLGSEGWRLVLKTKHLDEAGDGLRALVARSSGVELIDAPLPRPAMAHLWAATDLYASPHRSEGFGLTVAEAMARGLPVVATDYGGTRDFLDGSCGWPVPARRQRLEVTDGHYFKGGTWGEPDEVAFAQALRQAADRITAGDLSLGEAARARISERLSADAVGRIIRTAVAEVVARLHEVAA